MLHALVKSVVSTKLLVVARENDRVIAGFLDADAVVGEGVCGVEVEDEEETSALENNHFVNFVLERDVCLG